MNPESKRHGAAPNKRTPTPTLKLTGKLRPVGTADDEIRDENRRLRALLAAMVESGTAAAALVEIGWDLKNGRLVYTFCMPDRDEASAIAALSQAMSDRNVWDAGRDIAIQACQRVLKRHGLIGEAQAEARALAKEAARE